MTVAAAIKRGIVNMPYHLENGARLLRKKVFLYLKMGLWHPPKQSKKCVCGMTTYVQELAMIVLPTMAVLALENL